MEPISWEFRVDSSELKSLGSLNLIFIPTTEIGWYIYSSDNDPDSGPRTEFEFYPNKTFNIGAFSVLLITAFLYAIFW